MKFKILIIILLLLFRSNNSFAKVENSIVLKIENEILTQRLAIDKEEKFKSEKLKYEIKHT